MYFISLYLTKSNFIDYTFLLSKVTTHIISIFKIVCPVFLISCSCPYVVWFDVLILVTVQAGPEVNLQYSSLNVLHLNSV